MEYHLGGTAVQPPGRPLRSPCAASPWSPPSAASLVRYQSLGTGGDSLPLPPPPPGLHAQRCPGRGQGKAPGKRTAWCSLSACSGQPLGAADSQLDSGRSARANVTSPGGELSSQWGWGGGGCSGAGHSFPKPHPGSAPPHLPRPRPLLPGLELGLGRVTLPKLSPPAGRQAGEALLHSELAFPEPPGSASGWPARLGGPGPEVGIAGGALCQREASEDQTRSCR